MPNPSTLQVFEPAMCCSTGLCGPDVDQVLVTFAGDARWLKQRGVGVDRYNLGQRPDAFVDHALVYEAINEEGMDVLPLFLYDGQIVGKGRYPTRAELAQMVGLNGEGSTGTSESTAPPEPAEDGLELIKLELAVNSLHADPDVSAGSCCGGKGDDCC